MSFAEDILRLQLIATPGAFVVNATGWLRPTPEHGPLSQAQLQALPVKFLHGEVSSPRKVYVVSVSLPWHCASRHSCPWRQVFHYVVFLASPLALAAECCIAPQVMRYFAELASGGETPRIFIIDECGCRRAKAAAMVLEAWLCAQGVEVDMDYGPSAFWSAFIQCEVRGAIKVSSNK